MRQKMKRILSALNYIKNIFKSSPLVCTCYCNEWNFSSSRTQAILIVIYM